MTASKVRASDVLAGVGGVALLVVMFLPWYGTPDGDQSAWQSFSVVLVPLVITALLGIALLATTLFERTPALPVAAQTWGAAVGALTALLVLYRIANQPGDNAVVSVRYGAWVGLACVVAVTVGCWTSMHRDVRP
jgi:hypothetical protein